MTRPLFCFCAAFALGCIASQYFLAPALWLPAAGIVLVLGALGLLLRGPMRRRVLLCALGMAFAFGWNAAYARFIAAPNEALIGAAEVGWVCMLAAFPFAMCGFFTYNGMPAERFLLAVIRSEILCPRTLAYHPQNLYAELLLDNSTMREVLTLD